MSKEFNFRAWMIATLRRATYRYPPRYRTMNAARISRGKYRCAMCPTEIEHGRKNIQIDHIIPIVGKDGFPLINGRDDWTTYIERAFPPDDQFQALCRPHHLEKSKKEQAERKAVRDAKKSLTKKTKKARIKK